MENTAVTDTRQLKLASTEHPVHPLIRQRFSARAFTGQPLTEADMLTLFEAAAWAPSSMNEQPWRYRYALRGNPAFDDLWNCLTPGNQPWARHAAALVVSSGIKTLVKDGSINPAWMHDTGLANANILLQAVSMDLFGHIMGGIDRARANALLSIDEGREGIVCFMAFGHLGDPDLLQEPFKTRELTPRKRRPLAETVIAL